MKKSQLICRPLDPKDMLPSKEAIVGASVGAAVGSIVGRPVEGAVIGGIVGHVVKEIRRPRIIFFP